MHPNGALRRILEISCRAMAAFGWAAIDFGAPEKHPQLLAMLEQVQRDLTQTGLLQWPRVFLSSELDTSLAKRLETLVRSKNGSLAESAESATHLVVPSAPSASPSVRVVGVEQLNGHPKALEHTPFTPSSSDRWVDVSLAAAPRAEGEAAHEGPWRVSVRWLRDLEHWNEWMDEQDYEVSAASADAGLLGKRVRRRSVGGAEDADGAATNGKRPQDSRPKQEDAAGGKVTARSSASPVPISIGMPSHAAWLRLDAVHDLERRALPDFFDGSSFLKTPESYVQMRNFVINTYREQPSLPLTVTECRRNLAVDVATVMRLHQFLEHWGIINHNASTRGGGSQPAAGVALEGPAVASAGAVAPIRRGTNLAFRRDLYEEGGDAWREQDTLALLEALEMYEASWDDVANHVGKPVDQCIQHFLRLPIEEPYAQDTLPTPPSTASGASPTDPMLSQLALLAAAVAPPSNATGGGGEAAGVQPPACTEAAQRVAESLRDGATKCLGAIQQAALAAEVKESNEITRVLGRVIETHLKRLELKMRQVDELTSLMRYERGQLERMRHQVFAERLSLEKRRLQQVAQAERAAQVVSTGSGYIAVQMGGSQAGGSKPQAEAGQSLR